MAGKKSALHVDWKKYLFELIVIVTGITISFMVQNWQEAKADRRLEVRILERIHADLAEDTATLAAETRIIGDVSDFAQKLLAFETLDEIADSLNLFLGYQLQYSVFTQTDIGYQTIQQGGLSQVVSNKNLLNKIIRLYAIRYREMEEFGDIDKTFVLEQFIPYFNGHFPYVEDFDFRAFGAEKFGSLLKTDAFRNLLRTNQLLKKQGVLRYETAILEIAGLMAELEQEVESLK